MTASQPSQTAKPATAARMYDFFLGGTHNFPADREAAKAIIGMFPHTPVAAQVNRAFLRRAVRYLCEQGVRQFLDIGSGIPTEGNVHEIVQEASPGARVVYVDIDPVAVAESQELLQGNAHATAIQGDLRNPGAILSHPQVRKVLDFDQPIAVLLVAVLHFIDDDAAHGAVRQLLGAVCPGSYLVVSHLLDDDPDEPAATPEELDRVHDIYKRQTAAMLRLRTLPEIKRFFDGLEPVDPGIGFVFDWRPAPDDPGVGNAVARQAAAGGIGRMPA
ncbi:SAM-dependent methyltransferase [Allorhizocola rhizosphaerae]|uniref:SAM-dependent methyltransferase n=1 Tax=Allorhizocola rhizosphaerae TaxID=1872709 RepID=UPI000E3DC6C7|nr:SAM-dependent methyltransferase [Allorhizocola rhizosphaerae]